MLKDKSQNQNENSNVKTLDIGEKQPPVWPIPNCISQSEYRRPKARASSKETQIYSILGFKVVYYVLLLWIASENIVFLPTRIPLGKTQEISLNWIFI